ncbi:hypothetical protein M885DRAFT_12918 [Pelagophyceae sp. CCMP2097]|nr:hypothetical protein M885DRAFT_12918 [Pelagophyceae sp. CCMP2097]
MEVLDIHPPWGLFRAQMPGAPRATRAHRKGAFQRTLAAFEGAVTAWACGGIGAPAKCVRRCPASDGVRRLPWPLAEIDGPRGRLGRRLAAVERGASLPLRGLFAGPRQGPFCQGPFWRGPFWREPSDQMPLGAPQRPRDNNAFDNVPVTRTLQHGFRDHGQGRTATTASRIAWRPLAPATRFLRRARTPLRSLPCDKVASSPWQDKNRVARPP